MYVCGLHLKYILAGVPKTIIRLENEAKLAGLKRGVTITAHNIGVSYTITGIRECFINFKPVPESMQALHSRHNTRTKTKNRLNITLFKMKSNIFTKLVLLRDGKQNKQVYIYTQNILNKHPYNVT